MGRLGGAAMLMVALAVLVLPARAAIGQGAVPPHSAEIRRALVDATGISVGLPERPTRIVVLAPELAEILGLLGAVDAMVGRCDACDRPVSILGLPVVGPMIAPSIERILALRPDLVLASSQGNPLDVLHRLRELGLPAFGIAPAARGLAGVSDEVRSVAAAAGLQSKGEEVVAEFEAGVSSVRARVAGLPRVSACCLAWTDPLIAAGTGSFLDDLLDVAGADNACAGRKDLRGSRDEYPRVSREQLLLARPGIILLATGRAEGNLFAGWGASIPAVRDGRVVVLDADLFLRPTPHLAEAASRLADILAPWRAAPEPEDPSAAHPPVGASGAR
jgi:iron complex transport system substrate-binding protein